tara:strand:- start:443 stop:598 length:156 start_codon:yes stop_codon:yes gene_type:complete
MTNILASLANTLPNQFFTLFSIKVMSRAIELERINLANKARKRSSLLGLSS